MLLCSSPPSRGTPDPLDVSFQIGQPRSSPAAGKAKRGTPLASYMSARATVWFVTARIASCGRGDSTGYLAPEAGALIVWSS
jgi:hypothetical protein